MKAEAAQKGRDPVQPHLCPIVSSRPLSSPRGSPCQYHPTNTIAHLEPHTSPIMRVVYLLFLCVAPFASARGPHSNAVTSPKEGGTSGSGSSNGILSKRSKHGASENKKAGIIVGSIFAVIFLGAATSIALRILWDRKIKPRRRARARQRRHDRNVEMQQQRAHGTIQSSIGSHSSFSGSVPLEPGSPASQHP